MTTTTTNPKSTKTVVAILMGQYVCADHAHGKPAHAIAPKADICYVCAFQNGEPVR